MSRKLLVGTLLISAGILTVVLGLGRREAVYSRSVSEFLAHPLLDQPVRIRGELVRGSLSHREKPCEYRFRMVDIGAARGAAGGLSASAPELSVHYPECLVPDTFRDQQGLEVTVTVQGEQCASCHEFRASQLFVRAGGKYEMREPVPTGVHTSVPHGQRL